MITAGRITRQADIDGVPATTVERDYVLAHVLTGIASCPERDRMIFKGGTSLRLCRFETYRYSADLDFSLIDGLTAANALSAIAGSLPEVATRIAMPMLELAEPSDATSPRLSYAGPLGRPRQIKLDLADDELVGSSETVPVFARYDDQVPATVNAYGLDEVVAEKLRCVIQRVQCRDLFDLGELLHADLVEIDECWLLFEMKARHRGLDPSQFPDRFEDRIDRYRSRWDSEMVEHVHGEVPDFDAVDRKVRRALRKYLARRA